MGTTSGWTPERRAKQAELLRRTRPWEKSTGPKTVEGKAISSQNATRPCSRRKYAAFAREAREDRALVQLIIEQTGVKPFSNGIMEMRRQSQKAEDREFSLAMRGLSRFRQRAAEDA